MAKNFEYLSIVCTVIKKVLGNWRIGGQKKKRQV